MDYQKHIKSHVEVARTKKQIDLDEIQTKVEEFLLNAPELTANSEIQCPPELKDYAEFIQLDNNFKSETNESHDEIQASNHWLLPSRDFTGLWESLIYEEGLKENILKYVETTLLFSKRNVNPNIISCNRIVLLHGPPGTGKTSLCKAVAQKLSIRMRQFFTYTHLIEINSHSLFSKWFSESGKLVMRLFTKIKEIVDHPKSLVCLLIDEVESIAYARSSVSGNEPHDALRVVNSVLTQLDQIRKYPNVLILTTSNLTATIDCAFIDRADIKLFVGLPTTEAIYEIYSTAIRELIRVNIIQQGSIMSYAQLRDIQDDESHKYPYTATLSLKLSKIAEQSVGLSGRTLRKIPFLAHSLLIDIDDISLERYLEVLQLSLRKHLNDTAALGSNSQSNGAV